MVPSTLDDNIEDNKNNEVIPNEISNDIDFTKATRNADGKLCVLKEEMVKSIIKGLFHKQSTHSLDYLLLLVLFKKLTKGPLPKIDR